MAHIGLSDIESALKNSGLPLGNSDMMRDAAPMAGSVLEESMPRPERQDMGYRDKLAKIAAMDQKLSKLYSDPTSSMYIENPMARMNVMGGATNQQYQEAGDINQRREQQYQAEEASRNNLIAESEQYYKALVAIQDREEKALAKAEKASAKGTGKAKGTTRKTTTAIEEMAGFADPEAAKVWSSQLTADQKRRWLQAINENQILDQNLRIGDGLPPEGGYTVQDVMDFYSSEKAKVEAEKAKKKAEAEKKKATTTDVLETLMRQL